MGETSRLNHFFTFSI